MVHYCCASNCTSRHKQGCGISFHRFPLSNKRLLDKWIQVVGRPRWKPSKWSVLCSQHFVKEDFYPDQSVKRLREDAFPTIFAGRPPIEKSPPPNIREPSEQQEIPSINIAGKESVVALLYDYTVELPRQISMEKDDALTSLDSNNKEMNPLSSTVSVETLLLGQHDLSHLESLCRLCGVCKESSLDIFDEKHHYSYDKVINSHFKNDFQLLKTDVLPSKLCSGCRAKLTSWHEFYHNCLSVNMKFHKLMKKFDLTKEFEAKNPEAKTNPSGNDIEVIEVTVDNIADSYDIFNESDNTKTYDISNISIKETRSLANTSDNDFDPLDDFSYPSDDDDKLDDKDTPAKLSANDPQSKKRGGEEQTNKCTNDRKRSTSTRTKSTTSVPATKRIRVSNEKKNVPVKKGPLVATKAAVASTSSAKKDTRPASLTETTVHHSDDLEISEIKLEADDSDEVFNLECEKDEDTEGWPEPSKPKEQTVAGDVPKSKKQPARVPKMCEICGKVVNSKLFKEHMTRHSNPESMTCTCCGKLFSTVSTLKKHFMWTHTTLRPFMCDLCGSTFKRNDHLKLHRDHFHANDNGGGNALKCSICGASVLTLVTLQSHMKRVHGLSKVEAFDKDVNHKILADKSYECGICNMNFKQFSYLRIHIKFVHEKGLPWHINQGASGPYKCEPCKSSFATLQSLREHNRRRHDGAPVEKFHKECDHCGMLYRNRLHYSKHLAKISGRPTCYVCWKDFDDREILKAHINTDHLDELPFGCELCGVRFVYLSELRTHMYTHSETKQFKCDMCSQSFVRKDFLKSHMRRHLGIRNHVCEKCNKSFVEFCDLRKHMQIHLKNKIVPIVVTILVEIHDKPDEINLENIKIEETIADVDYPPEEEIKMEELPSRDDEISNEVENNKKLIVSSTNNDPSKKKKKPRRAFRICHLCGKNYNTESGFRHHLIMHEDPSFSCHLCGSVFYEAQNLKKHLAALHSDERPFQCHLCGSKYKRKDVLQEHIKRVHDGIKRVWNKEVIRKYRNTKGQKKSQFSCPFCDKILASKAYLNDHVNGVHTKEEKYKCNECEMTFTRKSSFKYHFKRAHILKKNVLEPRGTFLKDCEYCGLQFQIKMYYEQHVAAKHFNTFKCVHCGEIFDNKHQLSKHVDASHADIICKCPFCNKGFGEDVHLKRHIYVCHTDRKPYECHECGYKANKKATLEVHIRRHTGERPYQCDMCPRRFTQSVDYRKHRANHMKKV